jgi:hypothetical protein
MCRLKVTDTQVIIGILLLGVFLRAFYLNQPMRFDESATFLHYVNQDWGQLFNYTAPNNHVLNTLLIKLTTSPWGGHPFAIRLPAFIFGTACIPLVYAVCRRLGGLGHIAALSLAVHPYFILFSTNARGYSAVVFFSLLFLFFAIRLFKQFDGWDLFKLALIGSLGLFSIPIMLFPLSGLTLWMLIQLSRNGHPSKVIFYKFLLPFLLFGFLISLSLYLPVIWQTMKHVNSFGEAVDMLLNNEFVQSNASNLFLDSIGFHFKNAILIYLKDISVIALCIFISFVALGVIADYFDRKVVNITELLVVVLVATFAVFLLKHAMPYPRTWIFLVPFVAILADQGFEFVTKRLKVNANTVALLITFFCVNESMTLLAKNSVEQYEDTGRYSDAQVLAKKLSEVLTTNDHLISPIIPANLPIDFYLWHERVYSAPTKPVNSSSNTYIVMPNEHVKLEMYSQPPLPINTKLDIVRDGKVVKIFEYNGSVIYKEINNIK